MKKWFDRYKKEGLSCLCFMLTWNNTSNESYCNPFTSAGRLIAALNKKTEQIVAVTCTYHIAILTIGPPLALHLLLPRITSNDQNIPPRFRQAITTALEIAKHPLSTVVSSYVTLRKFFYSKAVLSTENLHHPDWFRDCVAELEPILGTRTSCIH